MKDSPEWSYQQPSDTICKGAEKQSTEEYGGLMFSYLYNSLQQDHLKGTTTIDRCKTHHYFIYSGQDNFLGLGTGNGAAKENQNRIIDKQKNTTIFRFSLQTQKIIKYYFFWPITLVLFLSEKSIFIIMSLIGKGGKTGKACRRTSKPVQPAKADLALQQLLHLCLWRLCPWHDQRFGSATHHRAKCGRQPFCHDLSTKQGKCQYVFQCALADNVRQELAPIPRFLLANNLILIN